MPWYSRICRLIKEETPCQSPKHQGKRTGEGMIIDSGSREWCRVYERWGCYMSKPQRYRCWPAERSEEPGLIPEGMWMQLTKKYVYPAGCVNDSSHSHSKEWPLIGFKSNCHFLTVDNGVGGWVGGLGRPGEPEIHRSLQAASSHLILGKLERNGESKKKSRGSGCAESLGFEL